MRAMLDSAIRLFAQEGYASVSTRRIAEEAGCSETLLFRYFGGKRGLLIEICQELGSFGSSTRLAPGDFADLAAWVEAFLLHLFAQMKAESARLKVITAAIVGDGELAAEFERRHDLFVSAIAADLRQFQQRGDLAADVDVQALAAGIEQAGFAIGLLMQDVYGKPPEELAAVARVLSRALGSGLRAGDGQPTADGWRQEALRAAHEASRELNGIVSLLTRGERSPTPSGTGTTRSRRAKPRGR